MGPIANHYEDIAKYLHAGVQNPRPEDEVRFRPTWIRSFNHNVLQQYAISAVRDAAKSAVQNDAKLNSNALGKPLTYTAKVTRHCLACVQNFTDAQGITSDARRLQIAVSCLGANVQGHWSAYVTCKPNPLSLILSSSYSRTMIGTRGCRRCAANGIPFGRVPVRNNSISLSLVMPCLK